MPSGHWCRRSLGLCKGLPYAQTVAHTAHGELDARLSQALGVPDGHVRLNVRTMPMKAESRRSPIGPVQLNWSFGSARTSDIGAALAVSRERTFISLKK